ncbi:MAG: hypothetical protein ILP13_07655, partial [Lachnospiraceae bacterium]|nr:hypothetical protein [Lachnospiraceae bacterium]
MKKRVFAILLSCILMMTGCGKADPSDNTAGRQEPKTSVSSVKKDPTDLKTPSVEPTTDEKEGYQFAFSEKQGFGTYISEDLEYEWDDADGLTIYTGTKGYIPYVLMFHFTGSSLTPENYFSKYFTPSMQQEYGDRLIEVGETKAYSIGGRSITGTEYHYMVQDSEVILLRLLDEDPFGWYMEYTAKYIKGEGDETLEALEDAVRNFTIDIKGTGKDSQKTGDSGNHIQKVIIEPPLSEKVKLKHVEAEWHTMDVPEEWWCYATQDPGSYTILVQDPEIPDRQIMINMGSGWFKTESAYKKQSKAAFYGDFWSQFPYLDNKNQQCTAGFYECFNRFADSAAFSGLPLTHMNDFTVLENFGPAVLGGDVLRGTYITDEGKEIQGIFMAHWTDVSKMDLMP